MVTWINSLVIIDVFYLQLYLVLWLFLIGSRVWALNPSYSKCNEQNLSVDPDSQSYTALF